MIYSNFYKKWIATCMRCKLEFINFETSANKKDVYKQNFYDYQILKKYFIIDNDIYRVRNDCGKCINKNCKAYMKNQ